MRLKPAVVEGSQKVFVKPAALAGDGEDHIRLCGQQGAESVQQHGVIFARLKCAHAKHEALRQVVTLAHSRQLLRVGNRCKLGINPFGNHMDFFGRQIEHAQRITLGVAGDRNDCIRLLQKARQHNFKEDFVLPQVMFREQKRNYIVQGEDRAHGAQTRQQVAGAVVQV